MIAFVILIIIVLSFILWPVIIFTAFTALTICNERYGGSDNIHSSNAIVMLCMLTDHYVLGACISAYAHRVMNPNVDLVVMCDEYIYTKYSTILSIYFDQVKKIDLVHYTLSPTYKGLAFRKYSKWIGYSTNKWQCLKMTEYNKILFLDTDILPAKKSFYDLFNLDPPAVNVVNRDHTFRPGFFPNKYSKYVNNFKKYGSIDGGMVLLKPSMDMYAFYKNMCDKLFINGIYSAPKSGPDEMSLYFYLMIKKLSISNISTKYAVVPWNTPELTKNAYGYNYLSFIKPWNKPEHTLWDEEKIWTVLYNNMILKNNILESLHKKIMDDAMNIYETSDEHDKAKYYNQLVTNTPDNKKFGLVDVNELLDVISQ